MNFFQSLKYLHLETADRLIVSVLFYNNCVGDDARKKVPLLLLKGTPQELDEGFFQAIEQPAKETAQLFANMEQFLKQKEQAKPVPKWKRKMVQKRLSPKSC